MVNPSMIRNFVLMGVFDHVLTRRVSFGREALASADAQCDWPVVARRADS